MNELERQVMEKEHILAESLPPGNLPPGTSRRAFLRALLVWLPLLACAGCLFVSYMLLPLTEQGIPVTGRDPLIPPPQPTLPESLPPDHPPILPGPQGFSYRNEALLRLETCSAAFHDFFLLEQVAVHQPEIAEGQEWRAEAEQAMQAFRAGCEPLGSMPAAPSAYSEVDIWLKLAAGEVAPAVDGFTVLLEEDDSSRMPNVIDHLLKFLEYTSNAEQLIDRLEKRKQI